MELFSPCFNIIIIILYILMVIMGDNEKEKRKDILYQNKKYNRKSGNLKKGNELFIVYPTLALEILSFLFIFLLSSRIFYFSLLIFYIWSI